MVCPFSCWICEALLVVTDHRPTDGLTIRRPVELGNDPAGVHHTDAIGQGQHLIEVFTDHQHRGTGIPGSTQTFMHGCGGAHVESAAGAVH